MPHQPRNPEHIVLDEEDVKIGEFFKDALADEADRMRHGDLRPGHAHFQIVRGIPRGRGRRGNAGSFTPKVDTQRQAVALTRFVDGVVEAMAKRLARTSRHHHLDALGLGA